MLIDKNEPSGDEILVIDDNPADLDLISAYLRRSGYTLTLSTSGKKALDILDQNPRIGIILLDLIMGGMDGFEVCKAVRSRFRDRIIQIVIISGADSRGEVSLAIELGADDFIGKPYSRLELQARIKAAFIRKEKQNMLFREREFYRKAVRNEERFSSDVLDQHLSLKKAYNHIVHQKKTLEVTNENLKKRAAIDPLSGLLNRASLFSMLDYYINEAREKGIPLSGIMLDIDHFKNINDEHGHLAGDEVIRRVGKILKSGLRGEDNAGRYGGEEFLILLHNTRLEDAIQIAERFRSRVEALRTPSSDAILAVTVSSGVSEFTRSSRDEWIEILDGAMYGSKRRGRNCVTAVPFESASEAF